MDHCSVLHERSVQTMFRHKLEFHYNYLTAQARESSKAIHLLPVVYNLEKFQYQMIYSQYSWAYLGERIQSYRQIGIVNGPLLTEIHKIHPFLPVNQEYMLVRMRNCHFVA